MSRLKRIAIATLIATVTAGSASANCITQKGQFGAYKASLGAVAKQAGIGQRGLQALNAAQLSDITWRFESRPSSQTGVSQGDPAKFLAKRSGSSAQNFVKQTRAKIARNPNTFKSIERAYGVPASLLATIWGLETSWGGYLGKTPVVSGAVTLSSYCRRYPKFETHAVAALKMADRGLISGKTRGGPSGELGHMQFLAGNWLKYGVDGNGDGRADPYNAADALATAANMLRRNGWKPGQPFANGTANFRVLSVWNDSGNYQRAIAYAAGLVEG